MKGKLTAIGALILTALFILPAVTAAETWEFEVLNPVPTANDFLASARKPMDGYWLLAGASGTVIRCDGIRFTTLVSNTQQNLNAVAWNPSGNFALLVGNGGTILRYDGTSFTVITGAPAIDLMGIAWTSDGSHALIVCRGGRVLDYNSTGLSELTGVGTQNDLYSVDWNSAGYALIVGAAGTAVRFNGSFMVLSTGVGTSLHSVKFSPDGKAALAAGGNGRALRYDGVAFSSISTATGATFRSVGWRANNYALLCGDGGMAYRYDGTYMGVLTTGTNNALYALAPGVLDPTVLFAGARGTVLSFDGVAFMPLSSSLTANWADISWNGNQALLVGGTKVASFDGKLIKELYNDPNANYRGVSWSPTNATALIVGLSGRIVKYENAAFTTVGGGLNNDLFDVAYAPNGSYALIVGERGRIWKYQGGALLSVTTTVQDNLMGVAWNVAGGYALVCGVNGRLLKYDGIAVSAITTSTQENLNGISWKGNGSEAMIVGAKGTALRFDGIAVGVYTTGTQRQLNGVSWRPDGSFAVLAAQGDEVLHFDGVAFTSLRPNTGQSLQCVGWKGDSSYCLVGGTAGILLKYRPAGVSGQNNPPTVSISAPTSGQRISGSFTVTGTASDSDAGDAISNVVVKIDNGNWRQASGTNAWSFTINTITLSNGPHTIVALAYDSALLPSVETPVTITVDNPSNQAPIASIVSISPSPAIEGNTVYFAGRGTDDGAVVAHEWTSNLQGALSAAPEFSTAALQVGTHIITYKVQDNGVVWSSPVTQSLLVQSANGSGVLAINAGDDVSIVSGQFAYLNGAAGIINGTGTVASYDWDFGDGNKLSTPTAATSHKYTKKGTITATLSVRDSLGRTATDTVTVNVKSAGTKAADLTPYIVVIVLLVIVLAMVVVAGVMTARKPAAPPPRSKSEFPDGTTPSSLLIDECPAKDGIEKPVVEKPAQSGEKPSAGTEPKKEEKKEEPKKDEKKEEPNKEDKKEEPKNNEPKKVGPGNDEKKEASNDGGPKKEAQMSAPDAGVDQIADILKDMKV